MLVDAAKLRRRRDPRLLLRAEAGQPRRRLPHVPGGNRGHPQAANRLLDAGEGRHGRAHAVRAREDRPGGGGRVPPNQPPARLPRVRQGRRVPTRRTSPSAGARGSSRFVEPKRHFVKPLELSPTIAIDRERCILCYRCVRFSQEISEDYQLVLLERGAHSYVSTFDGTPVRGPLQRQHRRAVPRGRADLARLPLPRSPVGRGGRRLGVHAVPVSVQRHARPCATSA